MDKKVILELKDAVVEFNGKTVLDQINLKVFEGETLIIIGPSGAGKTVLLKTLAGVYPLTSGESCIEGENWQSITNAHKHELARKLGMVFQQGALFDDFTCLENVEFPIREHFNYSEDEIHKMALELLEKVNLQDAAGKIPSELSGGMQRRLGIARAMALNPSIDFYDDPTAGQDAIQADQMATLIMELKEKFKSTVIIVTSSMQMVRRFNGRVVMIVEGKLIDAGDSETIANHSDPRVHQFFHGETQGPLTQE